MATARPVFATCATCHVDRHGGEAAIGGKPVDCAACHGVGGFVPATFTLAQHGETAFPLGGKHPAVRCAECHTKDAARPDAPATIRLRPAVSGCASCHATPHGDQLPDRRCEQCHTDRGWTELGYDRRDHAGTRLPLEGRHAQVGCAACHGPKRPGLPPVSWAGTTGTAGVVFRVREVRCGACHADPHVGDAGAGTSTGSCADCHGADAFRPARVAVEAHASFRFPLEGAHRAVACLECHTGFDQASGPRGPGASLVGATQRPDTVRLAAVRGTTCASCHDSPHGSQFTARADSGRCDACHVSDRFQDLSRFDHARDASFSLTGAHEKVACTACHRGEPVGNTVRVVYRGVPRACEDCHGGRRQP
jgi:mono/diheme cytochrome c family protein